MIEPIQLISMARCPQRQEAMIRQFSEVGLEYRIVDAVDGSDDSAVEEWEVDRQAFRKIYGREIRQGEIGCYASHLKAIDRIASANQGYGIVMEDDVVITKSSRREVVKAVAMGVSSCENFSMIYPGNPLMWGSHKYASVPYGSASVERINKTYIASEFELLQTALIGTQCYIISCDFAYHVLTHWNTIYRPIDEVYRILCGDPRFSMFHAPKKHWWTRPNWDVPSEIRT